MRKSATLLSVRDGIASELHAPARRRYRRRHVLTKGLDDLWQADLVDMQPYTRMNRGLRYILTVIDVYSKYAWAEGVKRKSGVDIKNAFIRIFKRSPTRRPAFLQTDAGTEFYNTTFSRWLRMQGIRHYSTYSSMKAAVVERFNRTLKTNMWRQFTSRGSYRWVDLLPSLVRTYNATKHRTIGMKPQDVKDNRLMDTVFASIKTVDLRRRKFRVGDLVRVSKYKTLFQKGYEPSWSTELFTIKRVHLSNPLTYTVEDFRGETIAGRFYHDELQLTHYPDTFLVERILQKKGDKRLVKWLGFDASHNSWIHARDITKA